MIAVEGKSGTGKAGPWGRGTRVTMGARSSQPKVKRAKERSHQDFARWT
jgi:hypothetical protein